MAKAPKTAPETPYVAARREWNERYGDQIATANNWRIIALGSVCVSLIAVGGLVYQQSQHKVVPYAVQFDSDGELMRVARAEVASTPNERQLIAALRNWVIGARTVYTDFRAQEAIMDTTYAMTFPDSAAFQELSTYHRANNPYERSQSQIVEVSVNAVQPIAGETWQIEWTETVKERSGKQISQIRYQGSFTILVAPPISEAQVMTNPLGIYVNQFFWTTRL